MHNSEFPNRKFIIPNKLQIHGAVFVFRRKVKIMIYMDMYIVLHVAEYMFIIL